MCVRVCVCCIYRYTQDEIRKRTMRSEGVRCLKGGEESEEHQGQ